MQEFESISASSYDPSALATKLTAKAAEGWSVVAIVPTGGDVTAFISRDKNGAVESIEAEVQAEETVAPVLAASVEPEPEPEPIPEAVSEPSGWAIAPEPATPAAEPAAAIVIDPAPSYQPSSSYQPAAAAAATVPPAAAAPEPAPTPAVPAGWYADPAGRFELRYWDGSTWTEHVSRAGQQFTDPPVA